MVTPQEIYQSFLLKFNKNDTNRNVKVPKSQFVVLFNEQKRKYFNDLLEADEHSDVIEDYQELLEVDIKLDRLDDDNLKSNFKLPDNFLKRVSGYSVASSGDCKNEMLTVWFQKPKDVNVLLTNDNYNPSFEYRETIAVINKDKISIYKDNFTVNETYLTYYREPLNIDIEGYKKIDGTPSTNISIDLNIPLVEYIVDRVVVEAARNYESPEQMQLAFQRQQLNEK